MNVNKIVILLFISTIFEGKLVILKLNYIRYFLFELELLAFKFFKIQLQN